MRIYRIAKNVKSYIQQYKIQDPFMVFFLYKYESIIPWNQVQTPEDVQEYIAQVLVPDLINRTNADNADNLYLKDIDLEQEFRDNVNNPQVQQAYNIYSQDPEGAKQAILGQINRAKQEAFNSWGDYLFNQDIYKDNPSFLYCILKPIFDMSTEDQKASVPSADALAVADIYEFMKQEKDFNVAKVYIKKLSESHTKNIEQAGDHGVGDGWLHLPSKQKDPANFDKNIQVLKNLSIPNRWCTGSGMAEPYLSKGDFWLLINNHQAKVAIRFDGDRIVEIQGPNNERPFGYLEEIIRFINLKGFDKNSRHFQELEECMVLNQSLVSGDDTYWEEFLGKLQEDPDLYDKLSEHNRQDPMVQEFLQDVTSLISNYLRYNSQGSSELHAWAKKILELGIAPQEWIDCIDQFIRETGDAPHFALTWAQQQFDSGTAPRMD